MGRPAIDIDDLTAEERLELIGRLWDSLRVDELPVPQGHAAELDRRLEKLDGQGPDDLSWEGVVSSWNAERQAP